MSDELRHYGTQYHSGRYPWGSGENPYQRYLGWRAHVQQLRDQGFSDVEIARGEGITTTQLRARNSLAKDEIRAAQRSNALRMKGYGYSNVEIGRRLGINESSVRSLLDPVLAERAQITNVISDTLKDNVDRKRFIDIGVGVENHLGVSRTRLNNAVALLEQQGYKVHRRNVNQVGSPGQFTVMKVLGPPDSDWQEIIKDVSAIKSIDTYSEDFGRSFNSDLGLKPVEFVSSDRVMVRYADDGGKNKDGVIELRRGVKDIDMGASQYAQVRIGVDDHYYLKGMAIYNDDMPAGVDIIFNTNKHPSGSKLDAMKLMEPNMDDPKIKAIREEYKDIPKEKSSELINKAIKQGIKDGSISVDPDNPFGASIKAQGQRGAINIVNEEGDWDNWSRTISSQVLSKQSDRLVKSQLDLALKKKQDEYAELDALTNPVVKKQLLLSFADDCDSSAVHLKAAALPRQASKVILPINELKDNEVYAPTFKDGETVVLIRHPHGGTFEIPQLTVNNRSKAAKAVMENAPDAIGINARVAEQMSGADFDGDAVIVIPNNHGLIRTSRPLKELEGFDPIEAYRIGPESKIKPIKPKTKQNEMGKVSNLITDMTIKGAPLDEIAKAVKHSMVVIDSEKHNLDYRQSYKDNQIASLSERYQNSSRGGASTLISKASADMRVDFRKPRAAKDGGPIDRVTGEKVYTVTPESYVNKAGKTIDKKTLTTQMAEAKDARELSSGRPVEEIYAQYANNLKALANESRREALALVPTPYNPSAKKAYASEVASLNAQLNIALKNKPLERQAQVLANSVITRKRQSNPDMDQDDIKKVKNQALAEARVRTGASKHDIKISDREWEAIQAGAISASKLSQILTNTNLDRVKELATPRTKITMTPTNVSRARAMMNSGATLAEIADALGVSTSTISNALS